MYERTYIHDTMRSGVGEKKKSDEEAHKKTEAQDRESRGH